MIEALGPTFIKLGQVVSSQTQSIPQDWMAELEKLQDSIPAFPEDQVRKAIINELHAPPEQLYKSFEMTPLAAASIGQVHSAVLMDNQAVVVKVQRPQIVPQIEADISIMREAARLLEGATNWAKNYGASKIVAEFADSLFAELDYRNEGRNADLLRRNLSGIRGMRTPYIYWELVTDKVLTMERIEGVKVTQVEVLRQAKLDLNKLADTFIRGMVQQILIDGFFHADVHPGNVFVDPKSGDIILIDLGMTGSLDETQRVELGSLIRALGKRDAHKVTQVILSLGEPYKPIQTETLEYDVKRLLKRHLGGSLSEFSYAKFLSELLSTLFSHGVRVPADLLFALKAVMQTEQIARTLNPDIKITDIALTASRQVYGYQFKPQMLKSHLSNALEQAMVLTPLLGDAIEQYLRDMKSGKRTIRLDASDLKPDLRQISTIGNRLTLALLLVGTIIGSVMAMSASQGDSTRVIYFLGVTGYVVSLVLIAILILALIRELWR
jgi:ubiquinone biosynthesis protein